MTQKVPSKSKPLRISDCIDSVELFDSSAIVSLKPESDRLGWHLVFARTSKRSAGKSKRINTTSKEATRWRHWSRKTPWNGCGETPSGNWAKRLGCSRTGCRLIPIFPVVRGLEPCSGLPCRIADQIKLINQLLNWIIIQLLNWIIINSTDYSIT